MTESSPSRHIASYIAKAVRAPVPPPVMHRAQLHLLDTIAAIISGSRLKPGRLAAEFAGSLGGPAMASIPGTGVFSGSREKCWLRWRLF